MHQKRLWDMSSFQDNMNEYRKQLAKGAIQRAKKLEPFVVYYEEPRFGVGIVASRTLGLFIYI